MSIYGAPTALGPTFQLPAALSTLQDAANESCIMHGHIVTDDGASHTIDTTGSSSIAWLTGAVTFANAGTTFKIGLATLDATTGPPTRATNVADVITFSVSKTIIGAGGGVTANAVQNHVPDAGTLTVANGDLLAFCTQMTTLGGADLVNTATSTGNNIVRPGVVQFVAAAYTATAGFPNAVITFSDGHIGWFLGGNVYSVATTTQTWNSGSATKEYGNFIQLPFAVTVYGIVAACTFAGDCDVVLYTDPLGTPVAAKTVTVDLNQVNSANARYSSFLFPAPYLATANQPLAAILKPAGTNVGAPFKTFAASGHQVIEGDGANCYAVNRASGAFAAQNSSKDRFAIGLLATATVVSAGGGISRARAAGGW